MSNSSLPEPLVPSDVDVSGFSSFMLNVDRVLSSELVALGTPEECWAAFLLWCRAWKQKPPASLPDDDRVLAAFSGAGARWKKIKPMALRGFVKCSDGRLYHRVLAEEALRAWGRREEFQEKQDNTLSRQQRWRKRVKEITGRLRELGVTPPGGANLETLERLLHDAETSPPASTTASTKPSTRDVSETSLTGQDRDRTETSSKAASDPPPLREADAAPPAGLASQPEEESEPDSPAVANNPAAITRLGRVCNLLRQAGVRCGPTSAGVAELASDARITDELLAEALVMLNERGKGTFGAPVVLLKVHDLLKAANSPRSKSPASEFPAWRTDDQQCDRLAAKLGMRANGGENYAQFRQRIGARLNELREAQAA